MLSLVEMLLSLVERIIQLVRGIATYLCIADFIRSTIPLSREGLARITMYARDTLNNKLCSRLMPDQQSGLGRVYWNISSINSDRNGPMQRYVVLLVGMWVDSVRVRQMTRLIHKCHHNFS